MCQKGSSRGAGSHVPRELKEKGVKMGNCKCRFPSDAILVPHVLLLQWESGQQWLVPLLHSRVLYVCIPQENHVCWEERAEKLVRGQRRKDISQSSHQLPNLSWFPWPPSITALFLQLVTCSIKSSTDINSLQGTAWTKGLRDLN